MTRVNSIAHKHKNDTEKINGEIIQEWIAGKGKHPVTWKTLTEMLRDSELNTLAGEIEAVKPDIDDNLQEVKPTQSGDCESGTKVVEIVSSHKTAHLSKCTRTYYNAVSYV